LEALILREDEIRSLVTPALALDAVREAFRALSEGRAIQPDSIGLQISGGDAELHIKGAYIGGADYFSFKAASSFYRNEEKGLPALSGLNLAFSSDTGFVGGILFDNGYLTALRTGAAGALAAELLSRPESSVVAMIGSGSQARFQLQALLQVRRLALVRVWSRNADHAEGYAQEMQSEHGVDVQVVESVQKAVKAADIVITTTASNVPLVQESWIQPGAHVTAVGSDFPDKQELDVGVLAKADRVVADTVENCLRNGEVRHAVAAKVLAESEIDNLGDIVSGMRPPRQSATEITVADQCGLGIEDTAMANLVMARATELNLGTRISI
jgi:ornithine cyclodeaminase